MKKLTARIILILGAMAMLLCLISAHRSSVRVAFERGWEQGYIEGQNAVRTTSEASLQLDADQALPEKCTIGQKVEITGVWAGTYLCIKSAPASWSKNVVGGR